MWILFSFNTASFALFLLKAKLNSLTVQPLFHLLLLNLLNLREPSHRHLVTTCVEDEAL